MVWTAARSAAFEAAGFDQSCLFGEMDHRVGVLGAGADAVEVVEVAAADADALRLERRGGGVGPGQPGDLVTGGEQFVDDGGADPPGRSGDENAHDVISFDPPRAARSG